MNKFHNAIGHKPQSGSIGAATRTVLALCFQWIFKKNGLDDVEIFQGSEPVDLVFHSSKKKSLFFAEVKAAPLLTYPLRVTCDELSEDYNNETVPVVLHSETTVATLLGAEMFIPREDPVNGFFSAKISLKQNLLGDLTHWISTPGFRDTFFSSWLDAYNRYGPRGPRTGIYWWTNACGHPKPRPTTWKQRSGTGYESISDGKTSVGMDRTDDLKKATYQVLKVATAFKSADTKGYAIKSGVVSNIHAIRQFDSYLDKIKDLVWAVDTEKKLPLIVADLDAQQPIYNLFDGICTLTQSHSRDEWIEELFQWSN